MVFLYLQGFHISCILLLIAKILGSLQMNQDQKIKKLLELFNRRYGIALFSILWNNHSHGAAQNLDEIYSRWQILRPSRTTFSILIREFKHAKVIRIVSGNKKSEKRRSRSLAERKRGSREAQVEHEEA